MSDKLYNEDSIENFTDLWTMRNRTATYSGSIDKAGAFTPVREIVSNSLDEFKAMREETDEEKKKQFNYEIGHNIDVKYFNDNSVEVRDYGRGIPMGWNAKAEKWNYELNFMTINAGGKGDNNQSYKYALGLNGIGCTLTVLSSKEATVESYYNGKKHYMTFTRGVPDFEELQVEESSEPNGTMIKWKSDDEEVFDEVDFPNGWLKEYAKEQSIVNKGIKINLTLQDSETIEYYYPDGTLGYLKEISDGKEFSEIREIETGDIESIDGNNKKEYLSKYSIVYTFNNENYDMLSYHNSSFLKQGGSPHDGIKSAFVYAIHNKINEFELYNKKESKISFEDIKESLLIITNTYSTRTAYHGQTKFAITNKFIKDTINNLLREDLEIYLTENREQAMNICKQVLVNKRSREKAEKSRIDLKKKLSPVVGGFSKDKVRDFVPASSKDKSKLICGICEGKSSLSSMKKGRTDFHAIFPIRGKMMNVTKAQYDSVMSNQEIVNLFRVLGCGMEFGKQSNFNIDNLQFDKIAWYVDADVDGMGSILPLGINVLWTLAPELIRQGKVYLGLTPKYEVMTIDDEIYPAMNEEELEEIKNKLKGKKYEVNYIKGLAELSDEGIERAMSLEEDNLIQITVNEEKSTVDFLTVIFGDDAQPRQELIINNYNIKAEEVLELE